MSAVAERDGEREGVDLVVDALSRPLEADRYGWVRGMTEADQPSHAR